MIVTMLADYIPTLSALAGTFVGGFTSIAASLLGYDERLVEFQSVVPIKWMLAHTGITLKISTETMPYF